MLNFNFVLNLILFALFELNTNISNISAEVTDTKQNNNSNLVDNSFKQVQSNKHVLNFEWDLDTAAGHKKEVSSFFQYFIDYV